ncbi:MAG TPA: apolipoprotein N-acyltransferase [Balneolaceae bacterium]|nr:apolipoprotein N-acyltransferase [Balneolaceae bacterium]
MKSFLDYIWNTKWALTLTAGILLGLSYPPIPLPFLVFPAFFLIFRIIDLSSSAREAAYWTYPAFVIWNLIVTYWLMLATLAGGIAAIIANSAVMTVPVMLQYYFQEKKRLKPWIIALLQAGCWLSYEYLHHQWDLAWPWLTVGNAWANAPQLVQYISVTGYWGISFWVLFSCALAYQLFKKPQQAVKVALATVLLIFPLWSFAITLFSGSQKTAEKQEVVVVQPNFDSYKPNGGYENSRKATGHLLHLTDSVRTKNTKLVVWPENAIQTSMFNTITNNDVATDTKKMLLARADKWNATIIAGATYFQYFNNGKEPELPYPGRRWDYLPYNAALGFIPHKPMQVYRKHNLVPIVERVPFVRFLNDIDIFGWINWNTEQGYGRGEKTNQFSVGDTKTPALVCYDSVFPGWIRNFVQKGAGYLTIITNDGWWGDTSGHEQHFAYARLRAIEFDRWIVRSANNGISGIIAPNGSLKVKTDYWDTTAFRYDVPVIEYKTLYARFGDWLPIFLLIITLGSFGYLLISSKILQSRDYSSSIKERTPSSQN